jgi:hypothetical protein
MTDPRHEHSRGQGADSGSDPRPRPQYGEYATPAEQRARIQHPAPPSAAPPVAPAAQAAPDRVPTTVPAARPGAAVNRIVTIVLLAYGAVNVVLSVFSFLDLAAVADATYKVMGVPGSFTSTPTTQAWGIAAAALLVVGFIVTAYFSIRVMRRGRVSWWIPLVGAAATYLVVSVCLTIPLMGDPALMHYILGR